MAWMQLSNEPFSIPYINPNKPAYAHGIRKLVPQKSGEERKLAARTHTHTHTRTHTHTHADTRAHTHIHTSIHTCAYVCVYVYIHMHTHRCAGWRLYTYNICPRVWVFESRVPWTGNTSKLSFAGGDIVCCVAPDLPRSFLEAGFQPRIHPFKSGTNQSNKQLFVLCRLSNFYFSCLLSIIIQQL